MLKLAIAALFLAACAQQTPDVRKVDDVDGGSADLVHQATDGAPTQVDDLAHAGDDLGHQPDLDPAPDLAPACGGVGQPCCAGFTCGGSDVCMAYSTQDMVGTCWAPTQENDPAIACGRTGQPPCQHGTCAAGMTPACEPGAQLSYCARLPQNIGTGWLENSPCGE